MRKWHRWLSLFFGVFMLWMAVTGVLSQIVPLTQGKPQQAQGAAPASISKLQPDFVCPPDVMCRPKQKGGQSIVGLLHHLHSGETFGPVGVVISTLTGFALLFFSISGIWLYVQMWGFRKGRGLSPRWFWK